MRELRTSGKFGRDLKLVKKRGWKEDRLWQVVDLLLAGRKLEASRRPHKLSGDWQGYWECHIAPDWLLIWLDEPDAVTLTRTGTHADLFG